ncbi:hypothetical protein ccbrp13_26450 [Ktedonobacteria bacterium brp13]|nr:hypothetical protein ccbrp13_26450 [Ktedonobacteria bacterium brp13]
MVHMRRTDSLWRKVFPILGSFFIMSLLTVTLHLSPVYAASAVSVQSMTVQQLAAYGEAKCLQPPQNANLLDLSDVQLIQYGLPTHAVIDQNLSQWKHELVYTKHRSCGSQPTKSSITHLLHPQPKTIKNTLYSYNWSGYVASAGRGTYSASMVTFNVPSLAANTSGSHVSIWAGMGGDGANPYGLVQAGIDSTLNSNGSQSNTSWWEFVSNTAGETSYPEEDLPLSKGLYNGNQIWVYVNSNPNQNGSDEFYIQNNSTNDYNSYYLYGSSYYSDSATGECVVERPSINGGLSPLANFGTDSLSQCQLYVNGNATMEPIGNYGGQMMDMLSNNGSYTLDAVGSLSNNQDFSVTYQNAN